MRRPDNLTTFVCRSSWNLGASTSWNPLGLSNPVMGLLYLYLLHSVCIIYMYINVCIRMHTHCEPWHNHVHGLAMGLVSSHHAWILGKITARMSNFADLCMLYSTLKWWEDNDFLCYRSNLLLNQVAKCLCLSFFSWDRGFESQRGHGYLSVVSVVCCQVEVSATSWSLVQRSPTDCAASLCVI